MIDKYKIITLCGSAKFKDDFVKEQKNLTLEGYIVLSLGFFDLEQGEILNQKTKQLLDDMHKKKIDLADEIFVINKDGYIGESTKSEIEYAMKTGKKVSFLEPEFENQKK